jgi:putative ABC transport system substrate-binding protein
LELGWAEGRNFQFDIRLAGGDARRMESNAVEVARQRSSCRRGNEPHNHQGTPAGEQLSVDCVRAGRQRGRKRPGEEPGAPRAKHDRVYQFRACDCRKWLEVLKEAAPQIRRAVALFSPETSLYGLSMPYIETAGAQRVRPTGAPVRNAAALEQTIDALAREPDSGLIVMPGPLAS